MDEETQELMEKERTVSSNLKPIMAKGRAVTLGLLIMTGSSSCASGSGSRGDVPLFPLIAWRDVGLEYGDQLMLRNESQDEGALLLKHSRRDTVYKYDETAQTLTPAADAEWQRADTPIAECGKQPYPSSSILRIDTPSHQLFAGNRVIPVAGRTALKLAVAPSGKSVAVLSASGGVQTSIVPFIGGTGASGQYYHQLLSLPEAKVVSQPVRLPIQRRYDSLMPCWSADERHVVYYQVAFNYLSIVTTNLSIPSKTEKVPK